MDLICWLTMMTENDNGDKSQIGKHWKTRFVPAITPSGGKSRDKGLCVTTGAWLDIGTARMFNLCVCADVHVRMPLPRIATLHAGRSE